MSDFLFSTQPSTPGTLLRSLRSIYPKGEVAGTEFHGDWGSLAVTTSRYHGFQPLETDRHLCVVLGGPVLYFTDNAFLAGEDPQAGTRAVLAHWCSGRADWSEDLSGPFVLLVVDKQSANVDCVTDLMMFIPVYQYRSGNTLCWCTHIDALAEACGQQEQVDDASLADFVLHDAVTYPYTSYAAIRQCQPAARHRWLGRPVVGGDPLAEPECFWEPHEVNPYISLGQAARALREGLQGYVDRVTQPLHRVAHFISAGEDSRVLAGMLPERLERDAFVFLDSMNREGRLAARVASAYGAQFTPDYRRETHYLDMLPEASALVGSGHQFLHAHTLGFDKRHHFADYSAVFGGYLCDSLLKGQYAAKPKWLKRFPFMPQFALAQDVRSAPVSHPLFSASVLQEVTRRRGEHLARVESLRPHSANEWFELWPATMRRGMSNLYSNRRLFASHEIFMAKESVKVAASAPIYWKLNRRLFHAAFQPALRRTRFVAHADGRFPYFPWWVNSPIQFVTWFNRQVARRIGRQNRHQGPWSDWEALLASSAWEAEIARLKGCRLPEVLGHAVAANALHKESVSLSLGAKLNLLQLGHYRFCASGRRPEMTVLDTGAFLQHRASQDNRSVLG